MLLVRWTIPDVSSKLRDQIRRETYITNEIIIKQEAIRASTTRKPSRLGNLVDSVAKMSASQFDLHVESQQRKRDSKRMDDIKAHLITECSTTDNFEN